MIDPYVRQDAARAVLDNPIVGIRELCSRRFFFFLKTFWPVVSSAHFKFNWHIEFLCDELQAMAERRATRQPRLYDLIFNIPPGTTKTITSSIMFPIWCWTKWHWMKFICASYSGALSLEAADYSRDLVRSDLFHEVFPRLMLDRDAKGNYRIIRLMEDGRFSIGGSRYSTSVGGTLTGFHGDFLLVDDPLNPQQAASETELQNAARWMDQTLPTRKTDKEATPTILIMQRLHEEDPTGRLLKLKNTPIRHICLPGEIRSKDYAKRVAPPELVDKYKDGLLDPERLNERVLRELEERLGQYGYAAQIGQYPVPPTGGMFQVDRFVMIETMPAEVNIIHTVRYWDKAGSKDTGAFTVGVKVHKLASGKFIISDVKRGQWSSEKREEIIRSTAEADGNVLGKGPVEVYHEQEPGSGGKESAESTTKNLAGFIARADRPVGDKVYRADPYSVQVNAGNVMLLKGDWVRDFIEEHRFFPLSKYKDQVDASSGAFAKLAKKRVAGPLLR